MGEYKYDEPRKQHISLTTYAWDVISRDRMTFSNDGEELSLAGFLNRVFLNFYLHAEASIPRRLVEKRHELEGVLKGIKEEQLLKIIDKLVAAYEQELKEKIFMYTENHISKMGKSFTIQKQVHELLTSLSKEGYFLNENGSKITSGKFIAAVFEEYAKKPYFEREVIFFNKTVITIHRAIELKRTLTVTHANGIRRWFLPYALKTDKLSMYNYLVGFSRNIGRINDKPKQFGLRLSNIVSIEINEHGEPESGQLSAEMREIIKDYLFKHDTMFLTDADKSVNIRVRLTEKGRQNYNKQIHMRPPYTNKEGDVYFFDCSMLQAEYYFFKFGKEAEILSPDELRKKFYMMYSEAATINKCAQLNL